MEKELEDFIASQMHNIKVRYHIVGKQEELQEIYDPYQTFIQKERPAMEEDEADDWEGNIILALGVDYGTCNLCSEIDFQILETIFEKNAEVSNQCEFFRFCIEKAF